MAVYEQHSHELEPIYDENSRILILGSFPSVKSREVSFYYGHPQNRFWKVISAVFGEALPESVEEKTEFLRRNHIALWDVIESCEISGSSDSSIRNVVPTDLNRVLSAAKIEKIFINGSTAARLYDKYQRKEILVEAVRLPSTSPANATWKLDRLTAEWMKNISGIKNERTVTE